MVSKSGGLNHHFVISPFCNKDTDLVALIQKLYFKEMLARSQAEDGKDSIMKQPMHDTVS